MKIKSNKKIFIFSILVCFVLLSWTLALAVGAEGEGEGGGGFVKEWLWKIVNFAILAGILIYFAKKPLTNYLSARTAAIKKSLDDAREAKELAQEALKEVQERLRLKDQELAEILANARNSGEAERDALVKEAERMSQKILQHARSNIDFELKKAKDAIREEAVELAMGLAERRLREKLTPEEQKKLLEESITSLEKQS